MKRFLLMSIRTLLNSLCALCVTTSLCILLHRTSDVSLLTTAYLVAVLIVITCFCNYIASRLPHISTREECKAEFRDVSSITRKGIIILGVVYVIFICMTLSLSYSSTLRYDKTYPNAEMILTGEFDVSAETMLLFKSLPCWISEKTYLSAQATYDATDVITSSDYSTEQSAEILDSIAEAMQTRFDTICIRNIVSILLLLLSSYIYCISKRCQQYHTLMRKLEET